MHPRHRARGLRLNEASILAFLMAFATRTGR